MSDFVRPPYLPKQNPVLGKDLIHYAGPVWTQSEIHAAERSLREGRWISSGEKVTAFERRFSVLFGFGASLMVNSGSSANLVMLTALKRHFGWPDDCEIITSVVGFPTTVAPILQSRMRPAFADIELKTLNFDLDAVERAVTPHTKAIFLSPVLGNPPDMAKLSEICRTHNLELILDGCDSLGSKWCGAWLSDYAVATSCSFYPAHHICTGEGGMVSSRSQELIDRARRIAWWGRDCFCVGAANALPNGTCQKRFDTWLGPEVGICDHKYVFSEIGYNLKPLDLQGAIGLEQLRKFGFIHENRRRIKKRIGEFLHWQRPELYVPEELPGAETSWFGIPIVCPDAVTKHRLVCDLEKAKIQTRNYFAGNLLLHPGYAHLGEAKDFPNANEVLKRVFFIGCQPTYSEEIIQYVEEQLLRGGLA